MKSYLRRGSPVKAAIALGFSTILALGTVAASADTPNLEDDPATEGHAVQAGSQMLMSSEEAPTGVVSVTVDGQEYSSDTYGGPTECAPGVTFALDFTEATPLLTLCGIDTPVQLDGILTEFDLDIEVRGQATVERNQTEPFVGIEVRGNLRIFGEADSPNADANRLEIYGDLAVWEQLSIGLANQPAAVFVFEGNAPSPDQASVDANSIYQVGGDPGPGGVWIDVDGDHFDEDGGDKTDCEAAPCFSIVFNGEEAIYPITLTLWGIAVEGIEASTGLEIIVRGSSSVTQDPALSHSAISTRGDLLIRGPNPPVSGSDETDAENNVLEIEADSPFDHAIWVEGHDDQHEERMTVGAHGTGVTVKVLQGGMRPSPHDVEVIPPSILDADFMPPGVPPHPGTFSIGNLSIVDDLACYQAPGGGDLAWQAGCIPFTQEALDAGTLACDGPAAAPDACTLTGPGWSVRADFGPDGDSAPVWYDATVTGTVDWVTITGELWLNIEGEPLGEIRAATNGYSVQRVETGSDPVPPSGEVSLFFLQLEGGVRNDGHVTLGASAIGSEDDLSPKGLEASSIQIAEPNPSSVFTEDPVFTVLGGGQGAPILTGTAWSDFYGYTTGPVALVGVQDFLVRGASFVVEHPSGDLGDVNFRVMEWPPVEQIPAGDGFIQPQEVDAQVGNFMDTVGYSYEKTDARAEIQTRPLRTTFVQWPGGFDHDCGTVKMIGGYGEYMDLFVGADPAWDLVVGSVAVLEVKPKPGCQFTEGSLEITDTVGETLKVDAIESEGAKYTFVVPDARILSLGIDFVEFGDRALLDTDAVTGAQIQDVPEGTIQAGSARLTVADQEVGAAAAARFAAAAGNRQVAHYLDLTLDEVILQGSADLAKAWAQPLTELSADAKITLDLSESLAGHSDYVVLREHNGVVTELETAYTAGALTFETDQFSIYAIAYKAAEKGGGADKPGGLAKTGMDAVWLLVVALAAAGAGVIARRAAASSRRA